jgi:hypothetical protein
MLDNKFLMKHAAQDGIATWIAFQAGRLHNGWNYSTSPTAAHLRKTCQAIDTLIKPVHTY